jgi:hypothetical protein
MQWRAFGNILDPSPTVMPRVLTHDPIRAVGQSGGPVLAALGAVPRNRRCRCTTAASPPRRRHSRFVLELYGVRHHE